MFSQSMQAYMAQYASLHPLRMLVTAHHYYIAKWETALRLTTHRTHIVKGWAWTENWKSNSL